MKSIRQKKVDLASLRLTPEEGFVLSRVEGTTTVKELVALTGLEESRVVEIVDRLDREGALDVEREPPAPAEPGASTEAETDAAFQGAPPAIEDAELGDDEIAEEVAQSAREERDFRKLYDQVYAPMTRDERVAAAADAAGAHLLALCLDAEPAVIHGVLTSPRVTLECARLVAAHHRTQLGLEHVARRADFLADAAVQRRLLRNPQLPSTILGRVVNPKVMLEVYKISISREIPERSRQMTREILRKKFMVASADERAALLFKTEGRCLVLLVNCSLDAHATQILCGKQSFTILMIQNLARWSATPPTLLGHLLKMQVVRHNTGLRKMILKHPNTPSELKRSSF